MNDEQKKINERYKKAIDECNIEIANLGQSGSKLNDTLINLHRQFIKISGVPEELELKLEEISKIRSDWETKANNINAEQNRMLNSTAAKGAVAATTGIGIATLGPSFAMGIATTFGVASTGTAISSLSGAAATNAALAWLGGGTLAAGGAGIAGGKFLLFLAGPVGWTIAGISFAISGFLIWKGFNEKKRLNEICNMIGYREAIKYELVKVDIQLRNSRIIHETKVLQEAIENIKTFGWNYDHMTEAQQYQLGTYVNLMFASTQLLTSPISKMSPKIAYRDLQRFEKYYQNNINYNVLERYKEQALLLANELCGIERRFSDIKILSKAYSHSDEYLTQLSMTKNELNEQFMTVVFHFLDFCEE